MDDLRRRPAAARGLGRGARADRARGCGRGRLVGRVGCSGASREPEGGRRARPAAGRLMPSSTVCLTFDFDALSVWLAYDEPTPAMLWRGEYGARVGIPRVLKLLDDYGLEATFFVPGHTLESFPDESESILAAGHEVAHHSYAPVDPSRQSRDEERADMERAWAALERV